MAKDLNGKPLPKGFSVRPDGRYQARFTYGGERYTLYGHNLKELKKRVQDMQYEVEHGLYAKREKLTVKTWFEIWITEYKANSVKYGTLENYRNCFEYYILPVFGQKQLVDLLPEHIQKFYNDMLRNGYARGTIELVSVILKSMLKQAVKNGIVKENPVMAATLPKLDKKEEPRVLSQEEQALFLEYAKESRFYDLYKVALFTGMRAGELAALEWNDVDFKNKVIRVRGTLKYSKERGYFKDSPKTISSTREIPMLDSVAALLKERKKMQLEGRLLVGELWKPVPGLENLVFTGEFGYPISRGVFNVDIRRILRRIGKDGKEFEDMTMHSLRHTFATRCIEKGMAPNVLQKIMGHSSLSMTMDLYAHVLPDTKAEQMQRIAELF